MMAINLKYYTEIECDNLIAKYTFILNKLYYADKHKTSKDIVVKLERQILSGGYAVFVAFKTHDKILLPEFCATNNIHYSI